MMRPGGQLNFTRTRRRSRDFFGAAFQIGNDDEWVKLAIARKRGFDAGYGTAHVQLASAGPYLFVRIPDCA